MSTPQMVPMIAPDGSIGNVPLAKMQDAVHAGFQVGVNVMSPDGQKGVIPAHNYQAALQKGFKIDNSATEVPQQTTGQQILAGAKAFGKEALGIAGGIASLGSNTAGDPTKLVGYAARVGANTVGRNLDNRSTAYKVVAGAADALGAGNTAEMEDRANAGDTAGVAGTALADATAAASPLIAKGAKAITPEGAAQTALSPAMDIISRIRDGNQANVMPEIGKLPPKIVNAAENIFQAAAPTGMNKGFRANLYAALPDLADVGRDVNLAEAKGGIINPDMRVRATVQALRDHLDEMYQTERAPQIQRNANEVINVGQSSDSKRGLEFLESTAPQPIRDAASAALNGGKLTVSQANDLAIAANQNLLTFEKATPEVRLQMQTTNPKIGGLKQLDSELSNNINNVLMSNGEAGLRGYERRFAALSAIRDQLESRMNATELNTPGIFKKVVKPMSSVFTGGTSGVASASQAAVADVNIGRRLQMGLGDLAASDLTAKQ